MPFDSKLQPFDFPFVLVLSSETKSHLELRNFVCENTNVKQNTNVLFSFLLSFFG